LFDGRPPQSGFKGRLVSTEKYLVVIGLSDEDTAHLRLMLRAVGSQLEDRWRFGTEDNTDLFIVDPTDLTGQITRNRAFSSGRRCAVVGTEELREGESRLERPFKSDALVALLNAASATVMTPSDSVNRFNTEFYDMDTFTPDFDLEEEQVADARTRRREENPAPGLDELLRPDTESAKPQFAVPINLDDDTSLSYAGHSSARSENRLNDSVQGLRREEKPEGINLERGIRSNDNGMFPLHDYLKGNLLGGPATIILDGAPPLTLDPKEKQFYAPGKLRELSPYCRRDFSRDAFRTVTSHELQRQRTEYNTHPYSQLIWLDVLIRSGGRLASHLDPGGRYRLKIYPKAEKEFPKHSAIVNALQAPAKLNEIATTARAAMGDVFDVVNAYDAIGLIEVERRLPRHSEPEKPAGLLARLRKPFGR
jgi:hypothetical protein